MKTALEPRQHTSAQQSSANGCRLTIGKRKLLVRNRRDETTQLERLGPPDGQEHGEADELVAHGEAGQVGAGRVGCESAPHSYIRSVGVVCGYKALTG